MNWVIHSRSNPKYEVRLGSCDREHAQSVVEQLSGEDGQPDDLVLRKANDEFRPSGRLRKLLG